MGMNSMGMNMMSSQYSSHGPLRQAQEKGKSRMVELDDQDWEAQFASLDMSEQEALDAEANGAMERELNQIDRSVAESRRLENETDRLENFETVWREIKAETQNARNLVDEEALNEQLHLGDSFDQWGDFDGLNTHSWQRDPQLGDYLFEDQNLFKDLLNPYEEGIEIMRSGGNLSLAALAFEAAVQKDPDHVDAWVHLGQAQAQNEKETPAIRALEQALKLDPGNLSALMGLAVSYTNESYETTAYRTLERWLSTKYPQLLPPDQLSKDVDVGFSDRIALHERITTLFMKAAQLAPSGAQMDPDVQVGLGVLFYGAEEYSKAVDCFSAALASSESGVTNQDDQVHLLWNRLGATLANSGRPEEAIEAYEKALERRPNFVRARYNLGVSCVNLGVLEQAVQHLLGALAMHRVVQREGRQRVREVAGMGYEGTGGPTDEELDSMVRMNESSNLYDTLRRVFGQMGRRDLAEKVVPGMDVEQFRGQFDF